VEDCAENPSIRAGVDGPGRDGRRCFRCRGDQYQPARSWSSGDSFDYRNELHEAAADFLQEAIDLERVLRIVALDDGERVEIDSVSFEAGDPAHDSVECRTAPLVDPVSVVQRPRAIDRQSDQKPAVRKKFAPFIVQKDTVRLD